MSKKYIILLFVLIFIIINFIIVGIGIGVYFAINHNTNSMTAEFVLKTNGGVPFKWVYEIEDESIVELTEQYDEVKLKDRNLAGGPVYIHYKFRGKKEGTTKITFKYVSITHEIDRVTQEEVHEVKVDKDNKITIIK